MLCMAAFAISWAAARASTQSIIIDEAETYEIFVGRDTPTFWAPASNNHVLNSMLMRLTTSAFGPSHLSVRAPALFGAMVYIAAAFMLSNMIAGTTVLRLSLFAALIFNPMVFDFFVAARGYSMALGFLIAALASAAWSQKNSIDRPRLLARYALASLFAGLSFCANFSFAFVCLALVLALIAWAWTVPAFSRVSGKLALLAAYTLPGIFAVALLVSPTLLAWPRGQLWDGATSLTETFRTVIEASLYEPNSFLVPKGAVPVLIQVGSGLIASIACVVLCRGVLLVIHPTDRLGDRWLIQLACVLTSILVIALALHWTCFQLFHILLPKNRTAIYLVPLCTLLAGSVAACHNGTMGRSLISPRVILVGLFGCLAVYYLSCMRLTYFREWQYEADVRSVYAHLALLNRTLHIDDVPSSWRYAACLNFYRRLSGKETFRPFESVPADDYPPGKRAYVLYRPFDAQFIQKEGLEVTFQGSQTDVVVAVRPPPSNAYDDTAAEINYAGSWIRDRQFSQAVNGTLTYSNRPGDSVRFTFHSTGVTWVYTRARNRGIAAVLVDGSPVKTINQYAPDTQWRSQTLIGGLENGPHRLEIRVLMRTDPRSADRFIDVDQLIVQ